MNEKITITDVNIPYGVLHDQKLESVRNENDNMIFTFDIKCYENDYSTDFYNRYKDFTKCNMIVEMVNEPFNYFQFVTCIDNRGKYKGISFNRNDFIDAINNSARTTFVDSYISYSVFRIELCVDYYNIKGRYKKYKKYDMCYIELDSKAVTWNWY